MSQKRRSGNTDEPPRKRVLRAPVDRDQLPKDCWTREHAAAFLGKSVDWVWRKCSEGVLPHCKQGARLIFFPDELEAWRKKTGRRGPS